MEYWFICLGHGENRALFYFLRILLYGLREADGGEILLGVNPAFLAVDTDLELGIV